MVKGGGCCLGSFRVFELLGAICIRLVYVGVSLWYFYF